MKTSIFYLHTLLASACLLFLAQTASADETSNNNSTTIRSTKLFTYAGPLIPESWLVVTTINDRVVLGFTNGSAINVNINDLKSDDRNIISAIRDGNNRSSNPSSTGITREKLSQWSSQFTSTVTKFGKSLKDQFDSFINNHSSSGSGDSKNSTLSSKLNETIIIQ